MGAIKFDSPFLDITQSAAYMKVKVSTIYHWVHQKKRTQIPVRYHGRKIVFLAEELKRWSDIQNGVVPNGDYQEE